MPSTIWILDDDAELGTLLRQQFNRRGLAVRNLFHPRELEEALETAVPDLLVLDELLPARRGTDLLVHLRRSHPRLPVLMLSALGGAHHRIAGLEAGANDYLAKPFLFRELQLRVERLLHPVVGETSAALRQPQAWQLGGLHLDPEKLQLGRPGTDGQELSRGEIALLHLLCCHAGDVVSRQELSQACGSLVDVQSSRSIDVRLSRLRRLLEELEPGVQMIETVRGQGYRLVVPVVPLMPTAGS
jgi:DNA-binding response OmpR family regulator